MVRRPPRSTRTDTLFPYPALVRSLVSRSILNNDLVGPNDFHACVSMPEHAASDVSRDFIDTVERAGDWSPEYVPWTADRSEEHTSELQSLMRIPYAVFCLKKKTKPQHQLWYF